MSETRGSLFGGRCDSDDVDSSLLFFFLLLVVLFCGYGGIGGRC